MVATMTTITRLRISNASFTSSRAIFLIFLWRCHGFRLPLLLSDCWFGLSALGGLTWVDEPRRLQLESLGS